MGLSPRAFGAIAALAGLAVDQANKYWLVSVYGIADQQPVRLAPFFDVVYARNPGISYSLLRANSEFGRWALFAVTFAATVLIGVWLWRARSRLAGLGLGLIVGGALGNAWDRFFYGAVADFYYFHLGSFSWYIFNLADCWIVFGVALLLFESFLGAADKGPAATGQADGEAAEAATKSPRSQL